MPTSKQKTGRQYIINKPQGMPGSLTRKKLHIISVIDEGRRGGKKGKVKEGKREAREEEMSTYL